MKRLGLFFGFLLCSALFMCCEHGRIDSTAIPIDVDGNQYDTVHIGSQIWMSQDLKVLHLPNGMALQEFGIRLKVPAYVIYEDKVLYNSMAAQYGADSSSAHVQGICPKGWHLPSSAEGQQLIDYVSNHPEMWDVSGTVSHALANQTWGKYGQNVNDNQTGFSAQPTGYVFSYDTHSYIGDNRWTERKKAYYWCSDHNDYYPRPNNSTPSPWSMPAWGIWGTDSLEVQSFVFLLDINQEKPEISSLPDIHYCAVRCVKDE